MKREDKILSLKTGDILMNEGESSANLYWCLEGSFSVTTKLRNLRVELGEINAGELIGELSFIDQKPRSATVKATSDSKLIVLPYNDFKGMMDTMPKWQKKIMLTLTDKIRKMSALSEE